MAITREKVFDKLQALRDAVDDSTIVDIIIIKLKTDQLDELIDDVAKDLDIEL